MKSIVFVGRLTSYGKRGYIVYILDDVQSKYSDVLKELWGSSRDKGISWNNKGNSQIIRNAFHS